MNIRKIMAGTLLSMTAASTLGCATTNTKIAQKINHGVNDFVSSINKLDYVDTSTTKSNLGKIVSALNDTAFINKVTTNTDIENTITKPSERNDSFKLYTLSSIPYISVVSDDNNINMSIQFSTDKIETASDEIDERINKLILKRAILMVYVNEIYNGNVTLTDDNKKAINAYVNVIKENASFLNGNRGMVKNQLDMASNLINTQSNENIVNYYIIKSSEALEIRSNKIDSTISAIDSIISILENNLSPSSCYYQNNLTTSYENMISNLNNSANNNDNTLLAKSIAESIDLLQPNTQDVPQSQTNTNQLDTKGAQQNTQNSNLNTQNKSSLLNKSSNISQNNQANNASNTNQINNYEIKTLEETEKTPNINQNTSSDFSRMTPSQRARARRAQREQNALNNQKQNAINPTTQNSKQNPDNTTRANRIPERSSVNTNEQQINSSHTHNKATRVPYTLPSTSNID